jgi:tetratricopeptide (TPR) repeat protein
MLPAIALTAALALPTAPVASDADDPAYVAETTALLLQVAEELEDDTPPLKPDLLEARQRSLSDLRGYAHAGIFPHNHESDTEVPIFVDEHGTHCAVAYMILASGERELAEAVADDHNQIRLPAPEPRVTDWAVRHGFSIEELSRVQRPGYRPRKQAPVDTTAQLTQAGDSWHRQGQYVEAMRLYERALNNQRPHVRRTLLPRYIEASFRARHYRATMKGYRQLKRVTRGDKIEGDLLTAYLRAGRAARALGKTKLANAIFRKTEAAEKAAAYKAIPRPEQLARVVRKPAKLPERKQLPSRLQPHQYDGVALKLLDIRAAKCGKGLQTSKSVRLTFQLKSDGTPRSVNVAAVGGLPAEVRSCLRATALQALFELSHGEDDRKLAHRLALAPRAG